MPQTINGIGTWYYGKNHLHTVQGRCEQCGNDAVLSSYDTVKYFVVLFIPVIPLQKLRILNECSLCQRHSLLPQKAWDEAKNTSILEVTTHLKNDPQNPEHIKQAIGTAIGYQDEPLFQATAKSLGPKLLHDHEVQVMIADGQRYFGHLEEAAHAYRRALEANDLPETREQLAVVLLKLGRPKLAKPLLDHLEGPEAESKFGFLWLLAEGFQAQGFHPEALEVFDRLVTIHPPIAQDKDYLRLRKLSEKNRESNKKIASKNLSGNEASYRDRSASSKLAPWIGPIIAVSLAALYFGSALYYGQNRRVHLINGLSIPYTVTLNDQKIELPGHTRRTISLAEGEIQVNVSSPTLQIPADKIELTTSFWKRPFFRTVFVVNPDRTAIIAYEKRFYAAQGQAAPQGEGELFSGDVLHTFSGIDFEFEAFPNTITTKGGGVLSKTQVEQYPTAGKPFIELFAAAASRLMTDPAKMKLWLKIRQQADPDNDQLLGVMTKILPAEESLELFQSQLAIKPIRVNVHRMYQETMESAKPDHDLKGEYRKLLDAEPDSPELAYLLGRIEDRPEASEPLFLKALNANPPVIPAAMALTYQHLSRGDFPKALEFAQKGVALQPTHLGLLLLRAQCWSANGKHQDLIDWARGANHGMLLQTEIAKLEARALVSSGKQPELANLNQRITRELQTQVDPQSLQKVLADVATAANYVTAGQPQPVAPNIRAGNFPIRLGAGGQIPEPVLNQDVESMRQRLNEAKSPEDAAMANLFFYVVESWNKKGDVAANHLKAAIEGLSKGNRKNRQLAQALGPEGTSKPAEFLALSDGVDAKRIWLAALATRFPADAKPYRQLAVKLNFERTQPYWWLQHWATATAK